MRLCRRPTHGAPALGHESSSVPGFLEGPPILVDPLVLEERGGPGTQRGVLHESAREGGGDVIRQEGVINVMTGGRGLGDDPPFTNDPSWLSYCEAQRC